MKKSLFFIAYAMVTMMLMITACEKISDNKNNDPVNEDPSDYVWDETQSFLVSLNGNSITVNPSAGVVSGGKLTITSSGTYLLNGSLSDGQIIVDTKDEEIVRLVLKGVTINCSNNAPVYIKEAKKAIIIIVEGTENFLTDGDSYATAENEPNAAIFSNSYLAIHGGGSLTVNGNYNDGISGDDGLIINSGDISVNASDDGIRGKDFLIIRDGNLIINSEGDGLISDNENDPGKGYLIIDKGIISIKSTGDGISAYSGLTINGGTFIIKTIGGNSKSEEGPPIPPGGGDTAGGYNGTISAKGLKGLSEVLIKTGQFFINSADDGIHSNEKITIEKGFFTITCGDDAIHADVSVTLNGGTINISGSYEGIESALINVTGGEINMMASDDGFNATKGTKTEANDGSSINIDGGIIAVNCTNGDGLDSNGNITINSGTVIVHGPQSQPEVGFDVNGTFKINGGFFVATGPNSGNMIEVPATSSTQFSVRIIFQSGLLPSSLFHIEDASGKNIITFKPVRSFYYIVVSSPAFLSGSSYSIYTGGIATGTNANGIYTDGVYSGGTLKKIITISGKVTGVTI